MKVKRDITFGEESTCHFKIDIYGEFEKIWHKHSKVPKIFTLVNSFWATYSLFELKKYRGVIFHETDKGYKILTGIDLSFESWHARNLTNFDLSTWKSQKFSI